MLAIQSLEVSLEQFRHLIGWAAVDPNLRSDCMDAIPYDVYLAASPFLRISDEKSGRISGSEYTNAPSSQRICDNKAPHRCMGGCIVAIAVFLMDP